MVGHGRPGDTDPLGDAGLRMTTAGLDRKKYQPGRAGTPHRGEGVVEGAVECLAGARDEDADGLLTRPAGWSWDRGGLHLDPPPLGDRGTADVHGAVGPHSAAGDDDDVPQAEPPELAARLDEPAGGFARLEHVPPAALGCPAVPVRRPAVAKRPSVYGKFVHGKFVMPKQTLIRLC